jgi:uncharacterized RDD family membrane protein YckC
VTEPSASWQAPEPEAGPAPGVAFASPGARLVGYIVDILIQGVLFVVLAVVTIVLGVAFFPLAILSAFAIVALAVGYFPYFWATTGQTPGMAMMKIKVVRDTDGGPITWGPAILRLIGFWVSSLVFYIGFIWIFIDKRRRGWMDLIAGTVVVEVPPATYTS